MVGCMGTKHERGFHVQFRCWRYFCCIRLVVAIHRINVSHHLMVMSISLRFASSSSLECSLALLETPTFPEKVLQSLCCAFFCVWERYSGLQDPTEKNGEQRSLVASHAYPASSSVGYFTVQNLAIRSNVSFHAVLTTSVAAFATIGVFHTAWKPVSFHHAGRGSNHRAFASHAFFPCTSFASNRTRVRISSAASVRLRISSSARRFVAKFLGSRSPASLVAISREETLWSDLAQPR